MQRERQIGLAVAVAGVLIVLFVLGIVLAHRARSLQYTVIFEDAQNLQAGDKVMLSGVQIGVVKYLQLHTHPSRVDVRLQIDPKHAEKVRADSTAIIRDIAFPNVSGQKIVEVINTEGDPSAPPMQDDMIIYGTDGLLELQAWKLKQKFTMDSEGWQRTTERIGEQVEKLGDEIQQFQTSPQVKQTITKLNEFLKTLREQGRQSIDELNQQWPALKKEIEPMMRELQDFGREYLVKQIQRIVEEIERTLEELRRMVPERPQEPQPSPAPAPEGERAEDVA